MCDKGFGLLDQLIMLAGAIVVVCVLGVFAYSKGVSQGKLSERATWTAKEKKEDNATILLLQKRIADVNVDLKKAQVNNKLVGESYEKELSNLRQQRDADRTRIRALGGLRISAAACETNVDRTSTETAGAYRTYEVSPGTIALPERIEENLWNLVDQGDQVSAQLRALQDWIRKNGFYND